MAAWLQLRLVDSDRLHEDSVLPCPSCQFAHAAGVDHQNLVLSRLLEHRWLGSELLELVLLERFFSHDHVEEHEAQAQAHADDRCVIPWCLLGTLEYTSTHFTLPHAGHGQAD